MSKEERKQASATVQVTIEVPTSSWGPDCTVDQVFRQAREEAIGAVRNMIHKTDNDRRMKIIGEPVVKMATYEVTR